MALGQNYVYHYTIILKMNYKINLFTYLKNSDLHCISAQNAILNLLKYDKLLCLKRKSLWDLAFSCNSQEEAEQELEQIISKTYYIINPNKEAFYLEKLPTPNIQNSYEQFVLQVISNQPTKENIILNKIQQKVQGTLSSIKKTMVWEISVKKENQSREDLKKELLENVIITSSHNQGILINPVYEKANFLDPAKIY
jgi:hypothetical protein